MQRGVRMKTFKKSFVALLSFFVILISILLTISCEIGLGSAVDTEPPSLEIAYPPIDSVIRGKFAIGGTWSDDGTIAGVTVSVKLGAILLKLWHITKQFILNKVLSFAF